MSLRSKRSLRQRKFEEDFDPMSSMGNLADCMLVLACGLLLALMIHWNVDVELAAQQMPDAKYEVEGVESGESKTIEGESELQEMGTVYMDPETGKYYVVEGE